MERDICMCVGFNKRILIDLMAPCAFFSPHIAVRRLFQCKREEGRADGFAAFELPKLLPK